MTESLHISAPSKGGRGEYTLYCSGTLDRLTYLSLRNTVVKAALDEPQFVIVDVNNLVVPDPSAWTVFTSARWHVSTWPDVPILLVCGDPPTRELIRRRGITRYVPVYPSADEAMSSERDNPTQKRRRARAELPANVSSIVFARELVGSWLTSWSCAAHIQVCSVVATELVENVLRHTNSAPALRLEYASRLVTVAVEDASSAPAQRKESPAFGASTVSGLAIVAALTRSWGSMPTPSGKTVWAVVGPECIL